MYNFAEKLSFFIQGKRYEVTHTQKSPFEDSGRVSKKKTNIPTTIPHHKHIHRANPSFRWRFRPFFRKIRRLRSLINKCQCHDAGISSTKSVIRMNGSTTKITRVGRPFRAFAARAQRHRINFHITLTERYAPKAKITTLNAKRSVIRYLFSLMCMPALCADVLIYVYRGNSPDFDMQLCKKCLLNGFFLRLSSESYV